jgi:hypothetical protein
MLARALVVVAVLAVLPVAPVSAGGRGHGTFPSAGRAFAAPFGARRPSVFPTFPDPWRFWGRQPRRHVFARPVTPSVLVFGGSTAVATTVGGGYYDDPGPVAGPVAFAPVASPPIASLVEYPQGWYQLRGDGVSAPYAWVWIPRPPPPPAAVPEAPAPPPSPPAAEKSEPLGSGPRIGDTFHYTDDEGVTTWTNRPEKIPGRFRGRAALPTDDRAEPR